MNHIRRILAALATLAGALLAFTAASPAAFAVRVPPPGGTSGPVQPPQVHTIVVGGNWPGRTPARTPLPARPPRHPHR